MAAETKLGSSPTLLLVALATGAMLAGCGGGSSSAKSSAHTLSTTSGATGSPTAASTTTSKHAQAATGVFSEEEMREYDGNEGRCHDDRGHVRDVGTVSAYCAFPNHKNDFSLIESSAAKTEAEAEEE